MSTIFLFDDEPHNVKEGDGVSWLSPTASEGSQSIPKFLSQNYDEIKAMYLAWIFDIGRLHIGSKTLTEYFTLDPLMPSLWSMSLVCQRSPLKSPALYQVCKLLALEKLYREGGHRGLVYSGKDLTLHRILKAWMSSLGHPYKGPSLWQALCGKFSLNLRGIFQELPHVLQAVIFLSYRWVSRYSKAGMSQVVPRNAPTIVSYFPVFDEKMAEEGRFRSQYWCGLHETLEGMSSGINWVWFFVPNPEVSFSQALSWRARLNRSTSTKDRFYLLEDFWSNRSLLSILRGWLKSMWRARCLRAISHEFHCAGQRINFFPFLKDDWKASFYGKTAIESLLYLHLFQNMARQLPAQPWGMFLWEGQAWEKALAAAWKARPESQVIGYQHSSLRTLDLRFFSDQRAYRPDAYRESALPDRLAVNGQGAYTLLRACGFPPERLEIVEALRYMYLNEHTRVAEKKFSKREPTLLVLTGYAKSETRFLLHLLVEAAEKHGALESYGRVVVRAHPYSPLDGLIQAKSFRLPVEISKQPLSTLLEESDVVLSANSTTASLEAAWLGLPVICIDSFRAMNLNPLFGVPGVEFVSDALQLATRLRKPKYIDLGTSYFKLDRSLDGWRRILHV